MLQQGLLSVGARAQPRYTSGRGPGSVTWRAEAKATARLRGKLPHSRLEQALAPGQHIFDMWVRDELFFFFRQAVPDLYLGGACELPELLPDLCPALLTQLPRREKQISIMPRRSNPAHPQVTQLCSGAGHNSCPSDHKPQCSEPFSLPMPRPCAQARESQPFCQPGIPRCEGWVCSKFTSTLIHQRTPCRKSP